MAGNGNTAPVPAAQSAPAPLFRNAGTPLKTRVNDLIGRLTLEEKVSLLVMDSAAILRLGIPAYHWWNECIHGVANAGRATQFPVSIAIAASWNPELVYRVASAVSDEMRSKNSLDKDSPQYHGLTCWGPTINMARDPRWGRTEETFGEDPLLTGRMAVAFVTGLQGDDPRYLKIAATPKHFAVHNQEINREGRDVQVSERALREYYLPAFRESIVTGKAASLMTAYNRVNGVPNTINSQLISDLLRKEWGFSGVVVPDVSAPTHLKNRHRTVRTYPEAAARFIKAGGSLIADTNEWRGYLLSAVKIGLLTEQELNSPLSEVLALRFRLGQFDASALVPYTRIPATTVGSPEHQRLAIQTAREGVVLLQNRPLEKDKEATKLLPLDRKGVRNIVVVGPYANAIQLGGYSGDPAKPPVSPFAGILKNAAPAIRVRLVPWEQPGTDRRKAGELSEADQKAIRESDAVIAVVGLDSSIERETIDRKDLQLPPAQTAFLKKVYALNRHIVGVLENGGPVSSIWMRDNLPAIVELWYPGEQGGTALADVLFGDYNPAGRLPLTVYESEKQLPPMDDYEVSRGRTYRYLQGKPLYPFGHGESYTSFSYSDLGVRSFRDKEKDMLEATIEVRNAGHRDGDEVVQMYGTKLNPRNGQPQQQLLAFRRIHLKQGEARRVVLSVPAQELAYWDTGRKRFAMEGGAYEIRVGASSADIRQKKQIELAER
jgi:beta-glucosidase